MPAAELPAGATQARPGARVRALAAAAVDAVVNRSRVLDDALLDAPPGGHLATRDRALLQELVYGAVRYYRPLAARVHARLRAGRQRPQPVLMALLVVGLYQLWHTRVPAHAVVSSCVDAARLLGHARASGFVNGVLREAARAGVGIEPLQAAREAHPAWLRRRIERAWPRQADGILRAGVERPPMVLRVNRSRITPAEYLRRLESDGIEAEGSTAVPGALMLRDALPVGSLPGFLSGLVSVQDAAAQLAAPWLDCAPGHSVLDACAAPGGKLAHVLETAPSPARVVAVDASVVRLVRARETLQRLGLDAALLVADATRLGQWWCGPRFDRILVDAPCSGTGVVRRHPDILHHRRDSDIDRHAGLQRRLLDSLWQVLAPGGRLLYVTCSVLPEENEHVISGFLDAHAQAREDALPAGPGLACRHGRQVLPGTDRMDGFYYARLEKSAALH